MATRSHKRPPSVGDSTLPSKKQRALSPVRRSDRTSKGTGGAVDQLKRVGAAVALSQKKQRVDHFAGEARNPMAPETPGRRTKKVSVLFTPLVTAFEHNP